MYVYLKRVKVGNCTYVYVIVEEYLGKGRRHTIAKFSLKKLLEQEGIEVDWCGGWDLNPRRPTPSGPEPDPFARLGNPRVAPDNSHTQGVLKQRVGVALSQKLLAEFEAWCKQHSSEETCAQYSRKLLEIDRGEKPVEASRWHITAYKRLARFLCEERGNEKACGEFRRVKSRRSGVDIYIPTDEEVRKALTVPEPLGYFYLILVMSGIRASEAARLLQQPEGCVRQGGFVRCPLAWKRGSKNVLWAYLLEEPRRYPVDLNELEEARSALGLVGFKYIRKWVSMKMKLLGMDDAAVNFIQGRVPANVLQKHYIDRLILADKEYARYAAWLRGWLH